MAVVERFVINGTDYGPNGSNLVQMLNLSPSGSSAVGTATLRLRKKAGGPVITNQMYVEIDRFDTSTNRVVKRYFCGFVARKRTGRLRGTNIKTWDLDLQDCNLLLYALVTDAAWAPALHIAAGSFPAQVAAVFAYFFTGLATRSVDATSQVADLIPGHTLAAAVYQGQDAIGCLLDIFIRAQAIDDTIRPTAMITPDPLVPGAIGAGFGPPTLQVYDAAAPLVVSKRFSDVPDGTHFAILQAPEFQRVIESAKIVQWQQAINKTNGTVFTGTHAASIAAYKNPFDPDNAWKAKPVELPTDIRTIGAANAWIARKVNSTAVPRETLSFATFEEVLPGSVVAVTWALEGLSEAVYIVASVTIDFTIPGSPVYVVELGARLLQLGDDDNDPVYVLPYEGDTTAPAAPSSFTLASNVFNYTTGLTDLGFTWVAPPDADLDPDTPYILEVAVSGVIVSRWIGAALAAALAIASGVTFTATLRAMDSSNNYSPPTALVDTAAVGSVPSAPTWPSGSAWLDENTYDPATGTTRVRIHWDANAGGEGVTAYRVDVIDIATKIRQYPILDGSVTLVLPAEQPNVQRVFKVYARNVVGLSAASAPKTLITAYAPAVAAVLPNPSFEVGTPDDPTLPADWDITLAGGGGAAATRSQAGGATDGLYALEITRGSGTSAKAVSKLFGTAGSGEVFHVAFDYKTTTSFTLAVDGFDEDGIFIDVIATYTISSGSGAWQHYDATLSITGGVASATSMAVRILKTSAGTAYIDNIHVDRQKITIDIADEAITTDKIAPAAVTSTELASGAVTQAKFASSLYGTSFPGSPASGDICYRSDRKRWYQYDGTRWLSAHTLSLAFWPLVLPEWTTGSSGNVVLFGAIAQDIAAYLERISARVYVNGTNDGSNYWTISFATAPNGVSVHSFNTSAMAASTNVYHDASLSTALAAGDAEIQATITATGTPGKLTVVPILRYREIG